MCPGGSLDLRPIPEFDIEDNTIEVGSNGQDEELGILSREHDATATMGVDVSRCSIVVLQRMRSVNIYVNFVVAIDRRFQFDFSDIGQLSCIIKKFLILWILHIQLVTHHFDLLSLHLYVFLRDNELIDGRIFSILLLHIHEILV